MQQETTEVLCLQGKQASRASLKAVRLVSFLTILHPKHNAVMASFFGHMRPALPCF